MTKVLLMIGVALGDSPEYYIAETAEADRILGNDADDFNLWAEACEHICEHEDVFKPFSSVIEALDYCKANNLEVEEEVDFVIY